MLLCANPSAQFYSHQEEIEAAVLRVMRGNRFILGAEVEALEAEFANYIGIEHAIGVANGTDALELALRSLGIGRGDEVITVSHTAVATVAAIEAAGATPVFVDVEPNYYTMDANQLSGVLSERTKAVIAVHIYGQAADICAIQQFCSANKLYFIEDVSQAHGAKFQGRRLGSFGDVACFSCYPTKNLGAIGDAGLIATNNDDIAARLKGLRTYGWIDHHYVSEFAGRNSRLDEIQAAILRVKLRYLDQSNSDRQKIARTYTEALSGLTNINMPLVRLEAEHVHHLFVVESDTRDELVKFLASHEVMAGIHYPLPVHLQPAYFGRIRTSSNMRVTEQISNRIISLPMYPELGDNSQDIIIKLIKSFYHE